MKQILAVGLDVHKESIVVVVVAAAIIGDAETQLHNQIGGTGGGRRWPQLPPAVTCTEIDSGKFENL